MRSEGEERWGKSLRWVLVIGAVLIAPGAVLGTDLIPVAHIWHNHMPNFWPYYAVSDSAVLAKYEALDAGASIYYTYDGDAIALKNSPPTGYTYYVSDGGVATSTPMPHDDLVSYYEAHAKYACYQTSSQEGLPWAVQTSQLMVDAGYPLGQVHITFSGALANNVNNIELTASSIGLSDYYQQGSTWGSIWKSTVASSGMQTTNGYRVLDFIHFAGHHAFAPLVGREYLEKDLIFHGATLAQDWFLGSSYESSNGYFPTELSFSERIIPTLAKMGITWSVVGNNHFTRALSDYPITAYYAAITDGGIPGDCADSPPNRADLRNADAFDAGWPTEGVNLRSNTGIRIVNKYPFASVPHYVRYVDPATGVITKVVGVPVALAESWEEGYVGQVMVNTADSETAGTYTSDFTQYTGLASNQSRVQFYVIAHDGDNSSGRSGSLDTWENGVTVTGASSNGGVNMGVDEYLKAHPVPTTDIQHVQDGSWADVTDASASPMFYHWHLPMCIWASQLSTFNGSNSYGVTLSSYTNLLGTAANNMVSLEYGWHYQEMAFAKLQAALNYAVTAEQIYLDNNPSHWAPSSALDHAVAPDAGYQLNPWMIAAPIKGTAVVPEIAWYFLLAAMDSGFGYYGENVDDTVKPVLAMKNSLVFSKPYVTENISQDRTGPSVWIPQRWPGNPGALNLSKAEGWTSQWFGNKFAVYSYIYDVSGMGTVNLMVREHAGSSISNSDDTYKLYHPAIASKLNSALSITTANVGDWKAYPMQKRDMSADMNGVDWIPSDEWNMKVVEADLGGDLYYAYLDQYRGQYLDYYIQASDGLGNITNTDIQQVYVGYGTYTKKTLESDAGSTYTTVYVEDADGGVSGTDPFISGGTVYDAVTPMPDYYPVSGYYSAAQAVQILDGADGLGSATAATIYYTTDGTTPTTSSTKYTGAVTVSKSTLVKAIAVLNGVSSAASSSTYLIGDGGVISVDAGTDAGSGDAGVDGGGDAGYDAGGDAGVSAPTGVAATAESSSAIEVTWTAVSGATSYTVYQSSSSSGSFSAVGTVATNSCEATGLSAGTTYYYYVTASDGTQTSAASSVVSATTASSSNAPSAPASISISVASSTSLTVSWSSVSGASTYNIYRATSSTGTFTKLGGTSSTSYTDKGLTTGKTYYYYVTAVDSSSEESGSSATVSATPSSSSVADGGNVVTASSGCGYGALGGGESLLLLVPVLMPRRRRAKAKRA